MAYTTINKSTDYFNTKLYTGNGSTQSITGVGFKPDWTWTKSRTNGEHHSLYDIVRGVTKPLFTNLTYAEGSASDTLTSFDTDGFSIGNNAYINENSQNYASWNWLAGGSQGSSNTNGSINTTYTSVNTTAGFSISSYTGTGSNATVGHGLGVTPNLIIVKSTSAGGDWTSYHSVLGSTKYMRLNSTNAVGTQSTYWQDTDPTSSVFSIGTAGDVNGSGTNYIAYCFAEKTGYSKFGSYTGNGNNNGTFLYTGFKPAFVIFKRTSGGTNDWILMDNKRDPYNLMRQTLYPNLTNSDSAVDRCDFLSNGIKLRGTSVAFNASGSPYIYIAFGQSLVGSNNVPCTAR